MDNIADAILISDLHLTDTTPISRTDNYVSAQIQKLLFIQALSIENNNCPILCAGDVFDYWKASPQLLLMAYTNLPHNLITIPGQHDLPMHSLAYYEKSALAVIEAATNTQVLSNTAITKNNLFIHGLPFGELNKFNLSDMTNDGTTKILILHELTWQGKAPSWDKKGMTDLLLLDKFGSYFDLILVGDNHSGFVTKQNDSIVVNPGSMMRKTSDQENYKPRCYLYYADKNDVTPMYFHIDQNAHNRKLIDQKNDREERIAAYISRMSQNWEVGGLSFKKNLEAFFKENKTPQKIRDVIWDSMEKN